MTTFFIKKFSPKAKNPRKLPIYPKFDVPKVPEVYGASTGSNSEGSPDKRMQ